MTKSIEDRLSDLETEVAKLQGAPHPWRYWEYRDKEGYVIRLHRARLSNGLLVVNLQNAELRFVDGTVIPGRLDTLDKLQGRIVRNEETELWDGVSIAKMYETYPNVGNLSRVLHWTRRQSGHYLALITPNMLSSILHALPAAEVLELCKFVRIPWVTHNGCYHIDKFMAHRS